METIIHQIAARFIEQVLDSISMTGIGNIGQITQELLAVTKAATLEIIRATIHEADNALVAANQARRADGLRIKERHVPRTISTAIGELRYERTYFETKAGDRCYLVDHLIGVEAYERLTKELCAALAHEAADKSMEKAAKGLQVGVSRQTVSNKVLALKEVAIGAERARETPKELHMFADEDHVHMKNGRSAVVPLVTVTEGIDMSGKRHKTINPVHFEGYGIDNDRFFENIASFLEEKYCMERVETVYVHADGGQWIRAAADWLPGVRFVMDGFHLEKRLRQLSRLEGAAAYMGAIRKAIREDDVGTFDSCCTKIRAQLDESGRKRMLEHVNFIRTHWEAVVLRMAGEVCGSCTEPLVSHILSDRLSRNPLAWSEHGIRQMAMLRVYVKNGGVVKAEDIRVSRKKTHLDADKKAFREGFAKYRAYADKQIDDFLKCRPDWSIFDNHSFHYAKLDGTSVLLKALGRSRDPLASA